MKKKLTKAETLSVASMLFGLFFGAGNLIFPAYMGQASGHSLLPALAGFLITGVGLPLLAVVSIGITHSSGVLQLSDRAGRRYGYFFTCALYLTIGPFFAIPRCFTVPFESGIVPMLPEGTSPRAALLIFSAVFFAVMLWFSLRPGKILVWVGKFLNPVFLVIFFWIMGAVLLHPAGDIAGIEPAAGYAASPLAQGILEGYNTMDALAGLAFGIVVIDVIKSLGVKNPGDIAACTVRSGVLACLLMAVIYAVTTVAGAQSRAFLPLADNGGAALSGIVRHYFPGIGSCLFALMILFACIKTAIGLITSCSEAFVQMFPSVLDYRKWAVLFSVVSFAIANVGLTGIIQLSLPVLMLLYPLAMTLVLVALTERWLHLDSLSCRIITGVTLVCAFGDFIAALPEGLRAFCHLDAVQALYTKILPLYSVGLGWMLPAAVAFAAARILQGIRKGRAVPGAGQEAGALRDSEQEVHIFSE